MSAGSRLILTVRTIEARPVQTAAMTDQRMALLSRLEQVAGTTEPDLLREALRSAIEELMEADVTDRLGAERHEQPLYQPTYAAIVSSETRPASTSASARSRISTPRSASAAVNESGGVISITLDRSPT